MFISQVDETFPGLDTHAFPPACDHSTRSRVAYAITQARETQPDIIVVQQHLPSAASIARKLDIPVILHRHNFQKSYDDASWTRRVSRMLKLRCFEALAGIIHVSKTCEAQFGADWPEVTIPRAVVPNALPLELWHPARERTNEILCVSRSAPEKGVIEAAQTMAVILQSLPHWHGRFILSATEAHPQYHAKVLATLEPVARRVRVDIQLPYEKVRTAFERAAIAIVPTKCKEAFGRTALEAHAGGAALVSSGTGALREVSGDCALYVDAVQPRHLIKAVHRLITDAGLRQQLGQNGRARVEQLFTTTAAAAKADAFFDRIHELRQQTSSPPPRRLWSLWGRRAFPPSQHPAIWGS